MKDILRILLVLLAISFSLPLWANQPILRNDILEAQTILRLKDLYQGHIDGVVGLNTRNAVYLYQKQKGLTKTGNLSDIIDNLRKETKLALINVDSKSKYATKEEVDFLKNELLYSKEVLHKFKELKDKIDKKIEAEVSYHIVSNFSELMRTSLTVLALVIALFSFLGIPKLHDYIKNSIKKIHHKFEEESEARIAIKVYTHLSHAIYLYYRSFFNDKNHDGFRIGVFLATWFSDGAIANAEKLPEGKERDKRLRFTKLHRAYHYASESLILSEINPKQQTALEIARELNGFIDKTYNSKSEQWINCKETIAWVYILLGTNEEKREGKNIVEELFRHDAISKLTLEEIKDNYDQIKSLSKFKDSPYLPMFIKH